MARLNKTEMAEVIGARTRVRRTAAAAVAVSETEAPAAPAKKGPPPPPAHDESPAAAKPKQTRAPRNAALKEITGEVERLRQIETAQGVALKVASERITALELGGVRARSTMDSLANQRIQLVKELAHSEAGRTAAEDALILMFQQVEALHTNILAFMTQWGINPEDHQIVWQRQQRARQSERRRRDAEQSTQSTEGRAVTHGYVALDPNVL